MISQAGDSDKQFYARIGSDGDGHAVMLEQAARVARMGYFIMNVLDEQVESCSERHAAIFGRSVKQFIEEARCLRGDLSMMHPDDSAVLREGYDRLKTGESIEMEFRFYRPDGTVGCIREFVTPETDETGRVVRGLGSSLDMTETRRAESRRAQAQRMESLGQLTAGVAHDFNNTLAVVLGNAELALELHGQGPGSDLHMLLTQIVDASKRGAQVTHNLLSFAQRARVRPVRFDLARETAAAMTRLQARLGRGVQTGLDVPHGVSMVADLDPGQFSLTLSNLLSNAADAAGAEGRVDISLRPMSVVEGQPDIGLPPLKPGRYALVSVQDNGPGMTEDVARRATEPFFTTKSWAEGSGLGLSMAHGFAQQAGGALWLDSRPGVGTTAHLVVPADVRPGAMPDAAQVEAVTRPRRVLVLEDDPVQAQVLERWLRMTGHDAVIVDDAEAALDALHRARFDVALLDHCLNGPVSGLDVARRAAQMPLRPVIVLMTGAAEGEDPDTDMSAVDHLLRKPVGLAEIGAVLDKPQVRQDDTRTG